MLGHVTSSTNDKLYKISFFHTHTILTHKHTHTKLAENPDRIIKGNNKAAHNSVQILCEGLEPDLKMMFIQKLKKFTFLLCPYANNKYKS